MSDSTIRNYLAAAAIVTVLAGCTTTGTSSVGSGAELPASEKGIVFLAVSGECQLATISVSMRKGAERLPVKVEPGFFARKMSPIALVPGKRSDVNVARLDLLPGDYQINAVHCVESRGTRTLSRRYSSNGIASFTAGSSEVIDAGLFVATPNSRTVDGLFGPRQIETGTSGFKVEDMSPLALEEIREKYPEEAGRMKKRHMAIDVEHLKEIGAGQCMLDALKKRQASEKDELKTDFEQCQKKFTPGSRKVG